jgi:uncharacterized protein YfaQ (DUF2300 family)
MMERRSSIRASRVGSSVGHAMPALDEVGLSAWIAQAAPGASLVYHRGFLVVDTDKLLSKLPPQSRTDLRRLADAAFRAAQQGLVHLVQTRIATDRFAYIAIARPQPQRGGAVLSLRLLEAA